MLDQVAHYRAVRARIVGAPKQVIAPAVQAVAPPVMLALPPLDPARQRRAHLLAGAPAIERVRRAVYPTLEAHGVAWSEIFIRSRAQHLVQLRWMVFRDLRAIGMTMDQIGILCGRDHTTVLHGLRKIAEQEADHANG